MPRLSILLGIGVALWWFLRRGQHSIKLGAQGALLQQQVAALTAQAYAARSSGQHAAAAQLESAARSMAGQLAIAAKQGI